MTSVQSPSNGMNRSCTIPQQTMVQQGPSEVLPGRLWIGAAMEHAYDEGVMRAMRFTHVLQCAVELDALSHPVALKAVEHTSMRDDEPRADVARAQLRAAAATIRAWLRDDTARILVHCWAGMSRSVSAVAAYLVLHAGMPAGRALALITEARPVARPFAGFVTILDEFEAERCARGAAPPPADS